eukprot:SAG31_NODE_4991_length_2815_cov_2.032032_4_plen_94_part_00
MIKRGIRGEGNKLRAMAGIGLSQDLIYSLRIINSPHIADQYIITTTRLMAHHSNSNGRPASRIMLYACLPMRQLALMLIVLAPAPSMRHQTLR